MLTSFILGTIHMYNICRKLMSHGLSSCVLEYVIWSSICMESSVPLMTIKYLKWRVQFYTLVCQCYYDLKADQDAEEFAKRGLMKVVYSVVFCCCCCCCFFVLSEKVSQMFFFWMYRLASAKVVDLFTITIWLYTITYIRLLLAYILIPTRHLLNRSQQWKHQNNV